MACNGCGTSAPMTKETTENLINRLIDSGKIGTVSDIRWDNNTMTWRVGGNSYTYTVKAGNFGITIKESVLEPGKYDVDTTTIAGKGLKSEDNKLALNLESIVGDYLTVVDGKITLDLEKAKPQYDGTGEVLLGYLVEV